MEKHSERTGIAWHSFSKKHGFERIEPTDLYIEGDLPQLEIESFADRVELSASFGTVISINSEAAEVFHDIPRLERNPDNDKAYETLTSREQEILDILSSGSPTDNKTIGSMLGISDRTVGIHLTNIFRKLSLNATDYPRTLAAVYNLRRLSYLEHGE